jgi:hypothetical protein
MCIRSSRDDTIKQRGENMFFTFSVNKKEAIRRGIELPRDIGYLHEINVDLSKLTIEEREVLAELANNNDRVDGVYAGKVFMVVGIDEAAVKEALQEAVARKHALLQASTGD